MINYLKSYSILSYHLTYLQEECKDVLISSLINAPDRTKQFTTIENMPWMMAHMPSPSYYYISMLKAKCVDVGARLHESYKTE